MNPFGGLFDLPGGRRMEYVLPSAFGRARRAPPKRKLPSSSTALAPNNNDNDDKGGEDDAWARAVLVDWARKHFHPSLAGEEGGLFVQHCRKVIYKFLQKCIKRPRLPSSLLVPTRRSKPALDWVVDSLLSPNATSSLLAATGVMLDLIVSPAMTTAVYREFLLEMLIWVYVKRDSPVVATYLKRLLVNGSERVNVELLGRVACERLTNMVHKLVNQEVHWDVADGLLKQDVEPTIKLVQQLLGMETHLDLFLAMSLLHGMSGLAVGWMGTTSWRRLMDAWDRTIKSPAVLCNSEVLHQLTCQLESTSAKCFPYLAGLEFALGQITHSLQAKPGSSSSPQHSSHSQSQATSIQLIRAPTQEEYFRASLRDPVLSLRCINSNNHPTAGELIAMIAKELETDAELLELIVCNKILKPTLDLALVFELVWKPYMRARRKLREEGRGGEEEDEEDEFDEEEEDGYEDFDDELMAITYRIVAIDGEASEDFITELEGGEQRVDENAASQDSMYTHTKQLTGRGFASLVGLMECATKSSWPVDMRVSVVLGAIGLLELSLGDNLLELQTCGLVGALLAYCFRFASCEHTCAPSLSLLESVCKGFVLQLPEDDDAGFLHQVLQRLDELELTGHKPSVSRLLPRLTGQSATKAAELIHLLPSSWLESVLFECGEDNQQFLTACFRGGIAHHCVDLLRYSTVGEEHALRTLKLLKGLVRERESAKLVCHSVVLWELVLIEEMPNAKVPLVGDLAAAILEILSSDQELQPVVHLEQQRRKQELSVLSNKKRKSKEKAQLRKQHKMMSLSLFDGEDNGVGGELGGGRMRTLSMEEDKREAGLRCCVCYEGLQAKPDWLLCAYVYCKQMPNQTVGIVSTVSSFVCIHAHCHDLALATEKEHHNRKDEWEGAQIRNGHAACNNLLPLRYHLATTSSYTEAQRKYFERVGVSSNSPLNRLELVCRDIRLLMLRVAFEESLIVHTGGGSIESNLSLLVPLLQLASFHAKSQVLPHHQQREIDYLLVCNAVTSKCDALGQSEGAAAATSSHWQGENRQNAFKALSRWAEQTSTCGSLVVPVATTTAAASTSLRSKPPGFKLKPWLVFFGMIDFVMEEWNFNLASQDLYELLETSGRMSELVRKLLGMSSLEQFLDHFKL
ncbi:hypothetical protein BASA81_004414 [Batrachochytrium salamandrivorans]|nr:hypothetical protein BASA81_004414 [Batrachochytrium salamandrivorans]